MEEKIVITQIPKKKSKKSWWKIVIDVLFGLFLVLSIIVAILSCIYTITPVEKMSMQPTINEEWVDENGPRDSVLINRNDKGDYNDIIVAQIANSDGKYVIKRLIAKSEDKLAITKTGTGANAVYSIKIIYSGTQGIVTVDDKFLDNMSNTYTNFQSLLSSSKYTTETIDGITFLDIPTNCIFYLGDNRAISDDCSTYGPVSANLIVGKVDLIIDSTENIYISSAKYFISSFINWFFGIK